MRAKPWIERIAAAEARGKFTRRDRERAVGWSTCAVGEAHAAHPLVVTFWHTWSEWVEFYNARGVGLTGPTDRLLGKLGLQFDDAVAAHNVPEAARVYHAIQDRVLELKRTHTEKGEE